MNQEKLSNSTREGNQKDDRPVKSWKIPISEERSFSIAIWEGKYGLSVALEESRRDEGTWSTTRRIYIPTPKAFETDERIIDAAKQVRELNE